MAQNTPRWATVLGLISLIFSLIPALHIVALYLGLDSIMKGYSVFVFHGVMFFLTVAAPILAMLFGAPAAYKKSVLGIVGLQLGLGEAVLFEAWHGVLDQLRAAI